MNIPFEQIAVAPQEITNSMLQKKNIRLAIARLDQIHPVVSGNKLFKLHYFLKQAIAQNKQLLTFGGAYSNHLEATAFAAQESGLRSVGLVRGEETRIESHTLRSCRDYGMQIEYIPRTAYRDIHQVSFLEELRSQYPDSIIIPEGGFHELGAQGASLIMSKPGCNDASHICVAVGTATTLAGLLLTADATQQLIGFPVLKNMTDIPSRIEMLTGNKSTASYKIIDEYHFGGYAKRSEKLLSFMNDFYASYKIPLDFVYTGKMMFGVMDKISSGYFPDGSNIICLHTGGLQGNNSLEKGALVY